MSGAVLDECNQLDTASFFTTEFAVHDITKKMNQVNVLPFVVTTDVVGFTFVRLMENYVDRHGMFFYEQPVSDIFSFSVNRNRFVVFDIVNGKRNQLLRELIRAIIV